MGYGIIREKLEDYAPGFESVGRITETAAFGLDGSTCTTVFNGTGSITSNWIDGTGTSYSGSITPTSTARVVSPDDKLPLYKHILLSEKYNFNDITWLKYGHGYSGVDCEMTADTNLGLEYPQDTSGTTLDKFVDFAFPYIQSWLIPLSMHAGLINNINFEEDSKPANFPYLILKESMSDITVHRYDISSCKLLTQYQEYDIITYQTSYEKVYDEMGNFLYELPGETREVGRQRINTRLNDAGQVDPMLEEELSRNVTVNSKYVIKEALMFDVKLVLNHKYTQYSDDDVNNRREDGIGFSGAQISDGAPIREVHINEQVTEDENYRYVTYQEKDGMYKIVTRTWEDELEQISSDSSEYKYEDVRAYNYAYGDTNLGEIPSDWLYDRFQELIPPGSVSGSRLEDIRWLFPYAIAAAKQVNGKILPSVLVAQAIKEGGWINVNAAKTNLLDPSAEIVLDGSGTLFGQRRIPGYEGEFPNIKTTGTIKQIEAYAYNLGVGTASTSYADAREIVSTPITSGNEEDYKERIQNVIYIIGSAYLGETPEAQARYKESVYGFVESYDLYKLDMLYDELEANGGIHSSLLESTDEESSDEESTDEESTTQNNSTQETENINEFTNKDDNYYALLSYGDNRINRVDIVNSKPSNYLQYMERHERYSNHVGYSRSYLDFCYDELKKLFSDYFQSGTVPFYYGSSLGYETYTGVNTIESGNYLAGSGGDIASPAAPNGKKVFLSYSNQLANEYTGVDMTEHESMKIVANRLKELLVAEGFEVYAYSDPNTEARIRNNMSTGKSWLQNKNNGIYVALHTNAGGGSGPRTFYYEGDEQSKALAECVNEALYAEYRDQFTGSIRSYIEPVTAQAANINEVKGTGETVISILTELAFHDNAEEAQWIVNNSDGLAKAVCNGIKEFYGSSATLSGIAGAQAGATKTEVLAALFPNGIPNTPEERVTYMETVQIPIWNGSEEVTMQIQIHKALVGDVQYIFRKIADAKFPIHSVGGYQDRDMVGSSGTLSHHAYGCAIDINSRENYMPGREGEYWKPGEDPYSMPADGVAVTTFNELGWRWGGDWRTKKDYMHFSLTGY